MIVNGKEVGLALTMYASIKIAEFCPDGDFNRVSEILDGSYGERTVNMARLTAAMNEAYEMQQAMLHPGNEQDPITPEWVMNLPYGDAAVLEAETVRIFLADQRGTIESEPVKKKAKQ